MRTKKAITRELNYTVVDHGKYRQRPIKVTLQPSDVLEFRIKGTRRIYEVPLKACFMLAEILSAETDFKERMIEYTSKKKAGYKGLRKPRKASYPYSKVLFKVLS